MTTLTTRTTTHASGRGLAFTAGCLATAGALAILLQDAIRSGDWTIEHGLIPVLMAVQILTGHLFVAAARQRKALPALGFALVATVTTWGVLDTSVAKQGAVQAEATAKAENTNGQLTEKKADLGRARQRLADADKMVDLETAKGGCPDKRRDGRRSNCSDWKQRAEEVRSHIGVIEAEIARLGPAQPVDARSENMATLIAALTGRDKTKIKHVLATVRPFTYALIFELAALVSFGFAFGHRPAHRPANENRPAELSGAELATLRERFFATDTAPEPPKPGASVVPFRPAKPAEQTATVRTGASPSARGQDARAETLCVVSAKETALRMIRDELSAGRTFPSQTQLCRTVGVARSTMSDWLTEWEATGAIPPRRTVGRCKAVG